MSGKKGMKRYPGSVKEQEVRMHLENGLTVREITKLLGLTDDDSLRFGG